MFRKQNRTSPYSFGENDWTDVNWKEGVGDYFLSKPLAEKSALPLLCRVEVLQHKLAVINPGAVFGHASDIHKPHLHLLSCRYAVIKRDICLQLQNGE